jgi:hypothetical protein
MNKTADFIVRDGYSCVNKDVPLFKVSVIRNAEGFAFIMSLSHSFADSKTYYDIYKMFDNSTPSAVKFLISERVPSYPVEYMTKCAAPTYVRKFFTIARMICFKVMQPPQTNSEVYIINRSWVDKQKCIDKDKLQSFVSTNDILVSWWARTAKLDFCLMAVNWRGRFATRELTQDHAGNYSGVTLMYKSDLQTPIGVRNVLSGEAFGNKPEALPTAAETLKFNVGIVTNWSSFYQEVTFAGCTILRHMPLFLAGGGRMAVNMLIFCPGKQGDLAAFIGSDDAVVAKQLFSDVNGPCVDMLIQQSNN